MQCARCAGMNVPEVIVEEGAKLFVMRCVHCGDVIDHVILTNHRSHRHIRHGRPRTSTYERTRYALRRSIAETN
jgi:uncharacterized Zn finger protein